MRGGVNLRQRVQSVQRVGDHHTQVILRNQRLKCRQVMVAVQKQQHLIVVQKRVGGIKRIFQLAFQGILGQMQIVIQTQMNQCNTLGVEACQPGGGRLKQEQRFGGKLVLQQVQKHLLGGVEHQSAAVALEEQLLGQHRFHHSEISPLHLSERAVDIHQHQITYADAAGDQRGKTPLPRAVGQFHIQLALLRQRGAAAQQ